MAEIPKVEQQNTLQALTERKTAVTAAKKRLEAGIVAIKRARELLKQNQFYEREIDGARGQMFMLMVAQLRHAEAEHSEEYKAALAEAVAQLVDAGRKAEGTE